MDTHLGIEVKGGLGNHYGPKIKIGVLMLTWSLLIPMKTVTCFIHNYCTTIVYFMIVLEYSINKKNIKAFAQQCFQCWFHLLVTWYVIPHNPFWVNLLICAFWCTDVYVSSLFIIMTCIWEARGSSPLGFSVHLICCMLRFPCGFGRAPSFGICPLVHPFGF